MLEISLLLLLLNRIGVMARRRGRSPSLFGALLLGLWFGCEFAGAALAFFLTARGGRNHPHMLLIYSASLLCAFAGAGAAFLIARAFSPVDGVWHDVPWIPVRRSRLWGAVIGGIMGGVMGAAIVRGMFGSVEIDGPALTVQGFLIVGFLGSLLGMISGVEKG